MALRHTALVLAIALAGGGAPPLRAQDGAVAKESIVYKFENDRFLIPRIDLELSAGSGRLVFSRKGISEPVTCDVKIGAATAAELQERLDRLDFLNSHEVYQTKEDHSNLGTTTISVRRGASDRDVSFNYTANRDMSEVASMLRGIANREIFRFDIETAARFQPLELPTLVEALSNELHLDRVTEPELLLPLLEEVADDSSLPLIARNKARKVVDAIRAGGRSRK